MQRLEIAININCPLSQVFAIYTQADLWSWSDFRSARWTQGQAWEVGSRLRIEPANSYGIVIDQVLIAMEINRLVGFISHFAGITMQSETKFRPLSDALTEVSYKSEFVGNFSRIAAFPLRSAIEFGAQRFLDDLKRECERDTQHSAGINN
ncbi:MAG TPA: hypothetical protein VKQ11_10105 [Candidatus Sulfotelmatobacter sp.]|nr:hypothetical protein [Candidatus Sulfotelmatobacter sp.]